MRIFKIIASITLAIVAFNWQYLYMSFELDSYCSKDAGIKIYENVRLPPSYFESRNGRFWADSMPTGRTDGSYFERTSDDAYRMIVTRTYLAGKTPRSGEQGDNISKVHTAIYRWSDKKLLGEEISFVHHYSSIFADAPAPHRVCRGAKNDITSSVFKRPA